MSTNLHGRLEDLWKLIAVYQPEMTVLEPKLRCFIPDYIPAVGDIDPMLKVGLCAKDRVELSFGVMVICDHAMLRFKVPEPSPLPAKMDPRLGFRFLDEPNIEQSDPTSRMVWAKQ